jgi:hypothetical protein
MILPIRRAMKRRQNEPGRSSIGSSCGAKRVGGSGNCRAPTSWRWESGDRRRRHTHRHRVIIRRRLDLLAIIRRRLTSRIEPASLSFPCQCDAGDAPFASGGGHSRAASDHTPDSIRKVDGGAWGRQIPAVRCTFAACRLASLLR